jgi:LacI family transcriptional regulator
MCIAGWEDGPIADRVAGWEKVLRRNGVRRKASMLLQTSLNRHEATNAALPWLAAHPEATAVFAVTDAMAFAVIRAASILGKRIPRDLALVGCEGYAEGEDSVPSLSSVKLSLKPLAATAVALLLDEPRQAPSDPVVIPASLIERESCGCA